MVESLYTCEKCGLHYTNKEEAEKCEKKPEGSFGGNVRLFNLAFYGLIGVVSSLVFAFGLYWSLLLDSNIASFLTNTASEPAYQWFYGILTFAAIVLFGANVSFLVYRWRKFGPPKLRGQGSAGLGSLFGVFASACPVCGSTLLSAIGLAGGIAAFPLAGIELKAASVVFLALPIWLNFADIKKLSSCEGGVCPAAKDASFQDRDTPWLYMLTGLVLLLSFTGWDLIKADPISAGANVSTAVQKPVAGAGASGQDNLTSDITESVLPSAGFETKIALKDSVLKLANYGVIDRAKFEEIYQQRGGLPSEFKNLFDESLNEPIALTQDTAGVYVNLLWGLGLSNRMSTNEQSPINGDSLFNFASTGGWTIGKEKNGGSYFNKFSIVELTPAEEQLVTKIAQNTYRPCCNNSTFFQDCNHGSAILGLLQLGAEQGLSEEELYREALAFNSFWFPQQYLEMAVYFKAAQDLDWENVDAKVAMSKDFSSGSGWFNNVHKYLQENNLIPKPQEGGGGCGV